MAFEQSLKRFCARCGIRVPFKADPKDVNTGELLDSIKLWLGDARRAADKATLTPHIRAVETARRVVLNPFAHSTPVTLSRNEIRTAVDAVERLDTALLSVRP